MFLTWRDKYCAKRDVLLFNIDNRGGSACAMARSTRTRFGLLRRLIKAKRNAKRKEESLGSTQGNVVNSNLDHIIYVFFASSSIIIVMYIIKVQ